MRKSPHEKFDSFLVFFFNFNLIHKGQRYIITCMINASTIAKARYNHYLAFTSHSNLKFWGDCGARASAFGLNLIQIKGVCVVGLVAALPSNLKFWGDCVLIRLLFCCLACLTHSQVNSHVHMVKTTPPSSL